MRQKTENYINVNLKVSLKNTQINRVPSNLIQKKKKKKEKKPKILEMKQYLQAQTPMLYTFMAVNFIFQRKIDNFQKKIDYQQQKKI